MRSGLSERVSLSSPFCYFYKKLRFNLRLQVETQLFIGKEAVKINILYTIADLLLYIQTLV